MCNKADKGGKHPKLGQPPNSIMETRRPDGSSGVTSYDDRGFGMGNDTYRAISDTGVPTGPWMHGDNKGRRK